jgi:hypothetical protein
MDAKPSFKTSVCSEYEALLHACKAALDELHSRGKAIEARGTGAADPKNAKALLALQEKYERGYSRLVKHYAHCELCRFSHKAKARNLPNPDRVIPFRRHSA